MGAAGGVAIYRLDEIQALYAELYPDEDIIADWPYLSTITTDIDGVKIVLDYADDQGYHEGSRNPFWFSSDGDPVPKPDEYRWIDSFVYQNGEPVDGVMYPAHLRVLRVLDSLKSQYVEVWT